MAIRVFERQTPRLRPGAYVDEAAVVIGDVELGADASVWPMAVIRGDIHAIRVGPRTNVQDGSVLHVTHAGPHALGGHPLSVGAEVTIGHAVVLHGCSVGDRCLIGMGCVVMDGVRIGPQTLLGAGSLVPPGKVLDGGHLWVGRPARRVRPLTEKELAYIVYSAEHYVRLKDRYQVRNGPGSSRAPSETG